jgi:hypothetical protein
MIIAGLSVTSDYQVLFNGVMFGPGTNYGVTNYKGFLDLTGVRTSYVSRPHKTGAYQQPHYADGAVFDLTFDIGATPAVDFPTAVAQLQAATYAQTAVLPLTFKLPGRPVMAIGVQCLNRAIPMTVGEFEAGLSSGAAVQFYAPDPRLYGAASTATTTLRQQGTGLVYPLVYPLNYGTPPSGGSVSFTNSGTTNTEPVFTVSGALSAGFQLTWVETGQHLTYSQPVGSDLVIDCGAGTAMTQGQDRTAYLTSRDWFSIPAGATATFAFAALGGETFTTNPGVSLKCVAAPAYI